MPYKIPFVGDQSASTDGWVSSQALINMFPELNPSESKGAGEGRVSLMPCPGYDLLASVGDGPIRGMIIHKEVLYVVSGDDFYQVAIDANGLVTSTQRNLDPDGAVSVLNSSTGPVIMTSSGHQGAQLGMTDGVQIYLYEDAALVANITNITQANPGVVTAAGHGLANGDKVRIAGVVGMTEVNGNDYIVASAATDTFALSGTNTSGFTAYTSGGTATRHRWTSPGLATNTGDETFGVFASADTNDDGSLAWTNPSDAASSNNVDATAAGVGQTNTGLSGHSTTTDLGGSNAWTNPNNAQSSNDVDATADPRGTTNILRCTNIGLNINDAAIITGVVCESENSWVGSVAANTVYMQLVYNGAAIGNQKSMAGIAAGGDQNHQLGGQNDTWGATLTRAIIEDSTFGVQVSYKGEGGATQVTLDHVSVNVYYTEATEHLVATDRSGADLANTDVVTGIEVDIEAAEDTAGRLAYSDVRLVVSGSGAGTSQHGSNILTGADATTTFGGSGELWGLSTGDLTPAIVNSEQFGVQVAFDRASSAVTATDNVQVDFINILIYYDSAGAVAPTHIEWFDDYFIANNTGTGDFYWTANGVQLWDADADKATAQRDPDNIQSIIKLDREIWFVGENSAEAWYNSGDSVPFDPIDNRFVDMGTVARHSVKRYSEGVVWLTRDERGAGKIIAVGGGIETISTPQIEGHIEKMKVISDAEAFTYYQGGHEFYQITFPTHLQTFVYDFTTGAWHIRQSEGHGRHIAAAHAYYAPRNQHLIGSYKDGDIYIWQTDVFTENGTAIKRERVGQSVHSGMLPGASVGGSRVRLIHHGFDLDCSRGHIRPSDNPADTSDKAIIELSWSDDGGKTYQSSKTRTLFLGAVGENFRVRFKSLGQSYDRRYRITTEAPVEFVIHDAYAEVSRGTW